MSAGPVSQNVILLSDTCAPRLEISLDDLLHAYIITIAIVSHAVKYCPLIGGKVYHGVTAVGIIGIWRVLNLDYDSPDEHNNEGNI